MRRLLITLILIFLPSSVVSAQVLRHTYSEAFRRPAFDVAVDSEIIWIADGYGVTIATRGNPPDLLGSKSIDGTTSRITLEGGYAWIVSGTKVVRGSWNGREIVIDDQREIGEPVYDIVGARGYLYLATTSGIIQIDTAMTGHRVVLGTTAGLAVSLATDGNTLVAADGDDTADVYSIELPAVAQKIGVANLSIASANRVHNVDGRLLASNGRDSQMFGTLRPPFASLGVFAFGAASAGVTTQGIVFTAGQDTTVRLVDLRFSAGRPSVVFEERLPPSAGTFNRVSRIRSDGNLVYVAGGDLGLQTYDIIDFGVPFPIVRSFVNRADHVVDLGNGQVVATGGNEPPRLYTIEQSGAVRETSRWEDQFGVTVLDHDDEVALVSTGGTVRMVRPSGTVTSQASFGAAVESGVVIDEMIWVTLSDQSLWRVPIGGGSPEKIEISGSTPAFLARGEGRLILGSFNDDGTTTIHELDRSAPSQSESITIGGFATSGAGVGEETVVVATFRGLSLIDVGSGEERLVPLGEGFLPRSLEIAGGEIVVLASDRVQRRRESDGFLIEENRILSSGLSLSAEGSSRVVVGAADAIYTLDLDSPASQPKSLGRLREPRFIEDLVGSDRFLHLVEGDSVLSRVLQNQGVSSHTSTASFEGDLVGVTATDIGFCGLESRGAVHCYDRGGRLVATGMIAALEDASFLSIHGTHDAVLVSLLEGCLGQGCRKRTVIGAPQGGSFVVGSEIEGEVSAIFGTEGGFVAATDLPAELRVYDLGPGSTTPTLVASVPTEGDSYALGFDPQRGVVYVLGYRVGAYSVPSLDELGDLLDPIDPTSGLSALDQRIEIVGDRAVITGRSGTVDVYRIDGPVEWTLLNSLSLPGAVRSLVRSGSTLALLTEFSLELIDMEPLPTRSRPVRR